jgi:hypothetical protein
MSIVNGIFLFCIGAAIGGVIVLHLFKGDSCAICDKPLDKETQR